MIRTVIWLLYAVILLIVILPAALLIRLFGGKHDYPHPYKAACGFVRVLLPTVTAVAGAKFEVKGTENLPDGPALFVANHQSDFDIVPPLLYLGQMPSIISKKENAKIPVAHLWMQLMGCIFIDRKNLRSSLKSLEEAQVSLEKGTSIAVFPEGTRSKGPEMREFKAGCFKCALAAQVPIVPYAIDGTYKLFEQQGYLKKGTVKVSILPPISTEGLTVHDSRAVCAKAQNAIQEELYNLRGTEESERSIKW